MNFLGSREACQKGQSRLEEASEKLLQAAYHTGHRGVYNLDDTRTQQQQLATRRTRLVAPPFGVDGNGPFVALEDLEPVREILAALAPRNRVGSHPIDVVTLVDTRRR